MSNGLGLGVNLWSQASDWPAFLRAAQRAERARLRPSLDLGPPAGDLRRPGPADLRRLRRARRGRGSDVADPAGPVRRGQHVPNPGLAVKAITTIDHISGGRAVLGIGGAWFEEEHRAFGLDFGSGFGQRLDWLAEAVPAMRALLDGEEVTSAPGGRYAFDRLRIDPPPLQPRLPIMIGGTGERKTLRIVAEHADIWNAFGTPEVLAHKDAVLRAHCADVGTRPGGDRADGRLQDHDPLHGGGGRARPPGDAGAQPDAARGRRRRRDLLDRDGRADRRDDGRLPADRLPHLHRRAAAPYDDETMETLVRVVKPMVESVPLPS